MRLMPPPNFRLSKLPAEIHHTPIQEIREVAEPLLEILDQYTHFVNLFDIPCNMLHRLNIAWTISRSATFPGMIPGLFDFGLHLGQQLALPPDLKEHLLELWEKAIRLSDAENPFFLHLLALP